MKKFRFIKKAILTSCVMTALTLSVSADVPRNNAGAPNAGVLLNELEPSRRVTPRVTEPKISVTVPKSQEAPSALKARIDAVVFECAEMNVDSMVQPLTKGKLHKEMTFEGMQDLALSVTKKLRDEGYIMAIAYVPAQELENNTLKIKIIIGRYGDVAITNTSKLMDSRILGYTYAIRPGELINGNKLDKSLLIMNEVPGVMVKATMEPGKKAGTAKLILDAKQMERQGGYTGYTGI